MKVYGIDQSLCGFGHTVLEDASPIFSAKIDTSTMVGFDKVKQIIPVVQKVIADHSPDVIVMEDYAYGARTNNLTRLAELGGVLKFIILSAGYATGREAAIRGQKLFMTQPQSTMKKFCLGSGAIKKDSRYLLEVFERIKRKFDNDDEADAFMHAWMAGIVVAVVRGQVDVMNLLAHQQESLIERASKSRKGLSITKAMKLPEAEKRRLAQELELPA